jgi:hypothetical protein
MIWIVNIPPEYDGLEIVSPAISYVLHNQPSETQVALVEARGGTITAIEDPFGGSGTVTVTQDEEETDVTDLGDGDYSFDPLDQYETDVEVTIDGGGDVTIKINFTLYQKNNIVTGGGGEALPMYAIAESYEAVVKVDYETGTTVLTVDDSNFGSLFDGTKSNFVCSDNGYLFLFWIGSEGIPIETHTHLVVIDPDGNASEALDIGSTSHQGYCMLAYDRAQNKLYLEADDFPTSGQTTLYTFSETGGALSSQTRDTSTLGHSFDGIAVYNGIVSYLAYDFSSGDDIIICDGVERFSTSGNMTGDILSPADGYVYALYSDSGALHLIKIDPSSGVEWTFDLPPTSTTLNSGRNLFVNDSGYSMVTVDIGGISGTFVIDPDGNYFDGGPVNMRGIDNYLNYFTSP